MDRSAARVAKTKVHSHGEEDDEDEANEQANGHAAGIN
jgi:hypothetical protein